MESLKHSLEEKKVVKEFKIIEFTNEPMCIILHDRRVVSVYCYKKGTGREMFSVSTLVTNFHTHGKSQKLSWS